MPVLVMNLVQARSKMKDKKAPVKVLKARRKDVRIIAMEMGTGKISLCL